MATLNETINQVQNVFNDIESALQEQGVDTSNMKPVDYANAVRGIVNNITVENVSFLPVMIFCYSPTVPAKPVGGNWVQNEYTNQITPPDGWYLDLNNIEDASIGQDNIYMSVCIFTHDNTKYLDWTTPVRISGKDGKDGKTGKQGPAGNIAGVVIEYNTPLYAVTAASQAPDKPNCIYDVQNNSLSVNSEGWSLDTPDENSLGANILWQSIARYYSDKQTVVCSNPVRISAGNPDIFRENGFYTEYCITKEINGAKTEWFTPASADPPVPTLSSPFLWARDIMNTTVTGKHVGPVYLFATYSAGLIGIDVSYACAPSKDALDTLDEALWFNDSASALTPDATKEYQGLTEDTKYLWAREQFLYSNKEPDIQYRIVSTFTAAEKAAIIYSAGTFNEKVKYTRTEEQAPYVFFADGVTLDENNKYSDSGKKYYYFVLKYSYDDDLYKIIPTNNTYPSIKDLYISSTASNKKCNWEKMESFDAIYSDIGVFKAANVGQFVFDDKYIFSQLGVDKDDKQEHNYTEYLDYSVGINNSEVKRKGVALAIETGQFIPNILLNAFNGEAKFGGGTNVLHSDGSFELADGNLQWKDNVLTVEGHVTAESFETKSSELETSISNLDNSVNSRITSASTKWANDLSEYQTATGETINQLNLRLDGAVSNYYKKGDPVTTQDELNVLFNNESWYDHIGDTWTNVNNYPDDENGGKSWRWCEWVEGQTTDSPISREGYDKKYHWHTITDNDASRALAEAGRISSELVNVAKEWNDKLQKAEDDLSKSLDELEEATNELDETISSFKENILSDNKFSKSELSYLESELQNVIADYSDLKNQLKTYENKDDFESDSDIRNAYSLYKTCLESAINGLSNNDFIKVPDNFETYQQDWYDKRTKMLQQFVSKSKNLVDTAQQKANNAQAVADQKTTTFINDDPQGASEGDVWIVPESYIGNEYVAGKTYVYNKDKWCQITDPDISKSSEETKDDLAKKLGYESVGDLETKSLIENGKIKTGLIDADAIVTDELISSKIAAATIAANSVKTTSASSVGSCELDGSTFKITGQDGTTFIDIGEHSSDYFDENKDNGIQNSIEETPSVSDSGTSITWGINGSKLTNASTIKAQIFKSGDTKCKLTISSLIFRVKYQMGSANNNWVAPVWKHWSTSHSTTNWNLLATDSYKPYLLIGSSTKIYPNSVTESEIPSSTGGTENTVAGKLLKFDSVIDVPSNTSVYLVVPANGINIVKFYSINNRSGAYTVNCSYTYSSVNNALISGSNGTMISSGKAFILAEDGKIETCGISNMGLHVGSGDIYGKYLPSRHILITDDGDTTVYLPELSETKPGDFFELWIGSNPNAKISTGDQYYLYDNTKWNTLNGTNNLAAGIYKCMRADSSWWIVKY